mmetsp:Transcript_50058/g.57469  ORF Transcript_50058/g.57469 Transcript_50058/m.57469 type:complete len:81 (-) Transcript_50058:111-353(-)
MLLALWGKKILPHASARPSRKTEVMDRIHPVQFQFDSPTSRSALIVFIPGITPDFWINLMIELTIDQPSVAGSFAVIRKS